MIVSVENWRPEHRQIGRVTAVLLLEIFRWDYLLNFLAVAVSMHGHLLLREIVDKLVSDGPQAAEDQSHIDAIEAEQPTRVVLLHHLHNLLDVLITHLPAVDFTEVKDRRPLLDLARHHRLTDDVVEEESGRHHNLINFVLHTSAGKLTYRHCQNFRTIHHDDRSHVFVALVPVDEPSRQNFLDWVVAERVGCLLPFAVLDQLLGRNIVLPLLALQNAKIEPVIVVVLGGQGYSLLLEMLAEGVQLFFFFFAQLLSKEDKSLVLAIVDCEKNLIDTWLI